MEKAAQGLIDFTELQARVSAVNSAHSVTVGTKGTHSMIGDKVSVMLCFRDLQLAKELSALPSTSWGQRFSLVLLAWLVSSSDILLAFNRDKSTVSRSVSRTELLRVTSSLLVSH